MSCSQCLTCLKKKSKSTSVTTFWCQVVRIGDLEVLAIKEQRNNHSNWNTTVKISYKNFMIIRQQMVKKKQLLLPMRLFPVNVRNSVNIQNRNLSRIWYNRQLVWRQWLCIESNSLCEANLCLMNLSSYSSPTRDIKTKGWIKRVLLCTGVCPQLTDFNTWL